MNDHVVEVFLVGDDRAGRRDARVLQQLGQVHLVRAAQDAQRVVNHHQAQVRGAAGKAIGVVVYRGGFSDEQRVELGEAAVVGLVDHLRVNAQVPGGVGEALDGAFVGWRVFLGRVKQHGQVVLGGLAPRGAGLARQVLGGALLHERLVAFRHLGVGDGADVGQRLPAALAHELGA